MSMSSRWLSLRPILLADAVVTGVTGLLMLLAARPLANLLDLPTALLRGAGLVLMPYVGVLLWLASRETTPRQAAWSVVAANIAWAVGCAVLLLGDWVDPNGLGIAFVVIQIVAVLAFADLQVLALRRGGQADRTAAAFRLEV